MIVALPQSLGVVINLAARGRNSEVTVICYLAALTRGRGTVLGRMELPRRANAWARYCTWSNGMCQCMCVKRK